MVQSIRESVRIAVAKRKSEPPVHVPEGRLSGDDLLGDLFESMHDLHFANTVMDGARFVLTLASTKLASKVAICHFFDINKREYVVVDAVGGNRDKVVLSRIPERDELANSTVRRRRAVVIENAATDARVKGGRWDLLGVPITSLVTAPVALGGRYLGMIELANPVDGVPYSESDGYALSYMGEQLAEVLGQRGVLIEPEVIRAFKPKG